MRPFNQRTSFQGQRVTPIPVPSKVPLHKCKGLTEATTLPTYYLPKNITCTPYITLAQVARSSAIFCPVLVLQLFSLCSLIVF